MEGTHGGGVEGTQGGRDGRHMGGMVEGTRGGGVEGTRGGGRVEGTRGVGGALAYLSRHSPGSKFPKVVSCRMSTDWADQMSQAQSHGFLQQYNRIGEERRDRGGEVGRGEGGGGEIGGRWREERRRGGEEGEGRDEGGRRGGEDRR